MRDELNRYEETMMSQVVRLEIPLKSVMNLRRVAEELRGLAYQLECMSRFPYETPPVPLCAGRRDRNRQVLIAFSLLRDRVICRNSRCASSYGSSLRRDGLN